MPSSGRRSVSDLLGAAALAAALTLAGGRAAAAQGAAPASPDTSAVRGTLFERLNLDRLRFGALGVAGGAIRPSKAEPTASYTLLADYGEIAPKWRVLFTATYWNSRVKQEYLDVLTDTLRKSIADPTNDYVIDIGRVRLSDIALIVDVQYAPRRLALGPVRPYLGGGIGAHVVNAEGRAINGTLVEQALDNITTGVAAMAGVDVGIHRNFSVGGQARFDLLSAARFASVRAVATYVFDPAPGRGR
jgi:opacity protein-like surface antigen